MACFRITSMTTISVRIVSMKIADIEIMLMKIVFWGSFTEKIDLKLS